MRYITKITLPVSGEASRVLVCAKQGDAGSRMIHASLTDENGPVLLPEGATATISMIKPDGTSIFNAAEIWDNQIVAVLTEQMLAARGRAFCDVNVFDTDGTLLSSSGFTLDIEKSAHLDDAIESSNEFTALRKIMEGISNPLSGKTLLNFGDSIAAGGGQETGYAHLTAERHSMTLHSYAENGATVSGILTQVQNAVETEADFVLLEGGYNDKTAATPMGALSDGYTTLLRGA